jgi:hypothetical protein
MLKILSWVSVLAFLLVNFASCIASSDDGKDAVKVEEKPKPMNCRLLQGCKIRGLCANVDGLCVATNADCRVSKKCKSEGRCVEKNGDCAVGSNADCAASDACELEQRCDAVSNPVKVGALVCDESVDNKCRRFKSACREANPNKPESWGYCLQVSLGLDDSEGIYEHCKTL